MPVLDRQFGIALEAVVIGTDLRFAQLALSRSSRCTLEGALGSSVSITEANGCTSSGHCSSLTQSGPFHTAVRSGRFAGYAGPSRRPAAEAISKYILVDMYAKAVQGMASADAVKWAHGELVKIYA